MLPLKDLGGRSVGEKVTGWDGKIWEEFEGLPGGRAWRRARKSCAEYIRDYYISVYLVKNYFKWSVCRGIAFIGAQLTIGKRPVCPRRPERCRIHAELPELAGSPVCEVCRNRQGRRVSYLSSYDGDTDA